MIGSIVKEQYQITELIGEGGMGVVYLALDLELERRVALKFLKAELADNSVLIQRFRDELRTLAGFNHPNITTLFTSVTWQDYPVMVMEFVEGETLQKMVDRRGPIPAHVCVPLIQQALAGVGSAHRKKIIHRDLKPSNLMLNVDGVVKVMDFGIAKIQDGPARTRSNVAIGTSLYMAPEQILGQGADARTDVYAMGVTLYELLAGRVPFLGDSQYAIEHAHMQQIPEPPTVHYPHIPGNVVDAVMRSLAKDPALRFQSAEEFAAALGDGKGAESPAAPPPAPPPVITTVAPVAPVVPPKRSGMAMAAVAAAAVLVLGVGGFWISSAFKGTTKVDDSKTFASGGGSGGGGSYTPTPPAPAPAPSSKVGEPDAPSFALAPPKLTPPPETASESRNGIVGQWTGSYERCEDGSSTHVALSLTEPAAGRVSGSLRFTSPDGTSGRCSMDGVIVGQGKKVTLRASACSGAMPAYFSTGHQSLLTYSGKELSGSVEPQDTCMTISLNKSGH